MNSFIEVQDLSFSYPGNTAYVLKGLSCSLQRGEMLCVLGPNGTGKSTLLSCLCGLLKPRTGTVLVEGENIHGLPARTVSRKIGYVQQLQSNNLGYTTLDYVLTGRAFSVGLFQRPTESDRALALDAMDLLGISHLSETQLSELSGGERQMVSIARVITQGPEIVLLDEPTSFLDYGNQIKILHLIQELNKANYTIILTSHNPDHCILLQAKVGILDKTGNFLVGTSDQILTDTRLSHLYETPIKMVYATPVNRNTFVFAGW